MKKLLIIFGSLLISATIMAQEPVQTQTQTPEQKREQVRTPQFDENGDPIMIQDRARTRLNDGQGTMTRAEKREMSKQNQTNAAQTRAGVQQQKRSQDIKQAKPMNRAGARPAIRPGNPAPRTGTMQRGGRK